MYTRGHCRALYGMEYNVCMARNLMHHENLYVYGMVQKFRENFDIGK